MENIMADPVHVKNLFMLKKLENETYVMFYSADKIRQSFFRGHIANNNKQ